MKKMMLQVLFCFVLSMAGVAQNNRLVKGFVINEKEEPLSGVTIQAVYSDVSTVTDKDGHFEINVSSYTKYVEASYEGYITEKAEIDGSYIVFNLKIDKKLARAKAKAEEEAKRSTKETAPEKEKFEKVAKRDAEKKAAAEAKAEAATKRAAEKAAAEKEKVEEYYKLAAEEIAAAAAKAEADAKRVAEKAKAKAEAAAKRETEKKAAAKAKAEEHYRRALEEIAAAAANAEADAKREAE